MMTNEFNPDYIIEMREFIEEYLDHYELNDQDADELANILARKNLRIDHYVAETLARIFPRPAQFWLNLQRNYDERKRRLDQWKQESHISDESKNFKKR